MFACLVEILYDTLLHHTVSSFTSTFNQILLPLPNFSCKHSIDGEAIPESGIRFRPPSGFTDSREFSETECDRDRALDLEVQRVMECNGQPKAGDSELTSLLAR